MVAVSIISHGHGKMVVELVSRLLTFPEVAEIIVTKNISEELLFPVSPRVLIIENKIPKGFGQNHNFAFVKSGQKYFCPLNPDIKLPSNPFPRLIVALKDFDAALVAPLVINNKGDIEDSARYFPTLYSLWKKLIFKTQGRYMKKKGDPIFFPEWIAGMFMLFESTAYRKINGFDKKYYLYYEDVDICMRLWQFGYSMIVDPSVCIIHDARRSSRANYTYMKWHLKSMAIYFLHHCGRHPKVKVLNNKE